jgi:hypothetical protein
MTDNLEQAGAAVDAAAAEVKPILVEAAPVVSGIVSHLESFGEIVKEDIEAAITWLKSKL